ncbi:MAG: hypothetical protein E7588_03960 [Ruminococcaceae bacterium]|nr:hypothetical protein [Oscillospiraceae bacterium]
MKIKNVFNSRKFKYGSVAMIFSVVFIVMVIVVNLIFTALDDKYNLKYDMTSSGIFTITEATEKALGDIDTDVTIKFLEPIDKVAENDLGKYIKECAESYAQKFTNVKLEYVDMVRYPAQINKYRESGEIKTTSVIVESSLRYRVLSRDSFFVNDGQYYVGFNGEKKLTSAILQVTNPRQPVVTFTQNHGETVPASMLEVFNNAGYLVERKDISVEAINPDTEIIVINNPTTDFFGLNTAKEGGVSEIEILNDYMNSFKHVMVFLSADNTAQLPELEELLASRGIKVNRGSKIKDMGAAITPDGYISIAQPTGEMYGSMLTKGVTGRTIVANSAPIDILFTDKSVSEDGAYVYTYDTIYVDPVLSTTAEAVASNHDETESKGPFNTMVLSSKYDYVNNEKTYSHLLVASTDSFSNYIGSNSFGNEDILYNAMTVMGQEKVPTDIGYKLFDNSMLEKIDQEAVTRWSWFLIGAIPLAIAASGLIVWLRRRHR